MRLSLMYWLAASLVVPIGGASSAPLQQNGWVIYDASHTDQTLPCPPQPVLLRGSHTDTTLKRGCVYVRVAGEHNDVEVQLGPAATVEITGAHNDVFWSQTAPGPAPRLVDAGASNTFHHGQE